MLTLATTGAGGATMTSREIETAPTREELRREISYNHETGEFTRLHSTSSQGRKGVIKGSLVENHCGKAYLRFGVLGKSHFAHRLAFIYMTGAAPEQVDHINGNGLDNRWANLRASTNSLNSKNQRLRDSNTSGQMGVSWHKGTQQWAIRINSNGKRLNLGYRKTLEDAIAVRKAAELAHGYDENHGKPRPKFSAQVARRAAEVPHA